MTDLTTQPPPTTTTTTKTSNDDRIHKTGTGGIAWAGSLVGSQNPNTNLGFRYSHKRYKRSSSDDDETNKATLLPTNVVVQFQDRSETRVGNLVDIPTNSDVDALSALVHSLLEPPPADDDDLDEPSSSEQTKTTKIPYSFYAKITRDGIEDEVEITTTLSDLIQKHGIGTEEVISLTYRPLAVFRVRPVTRCADTMPGHTEAVLHVSFSPDGRNLASGGGDTSVRFWDVHTNLPRHTCLAHKNHVLCTAWSPDSRRFASGDKNGVLIVWDPEAKASASTSTDITGDGGGGGGKKNQRRKAAEDAIRTRTIKAHGKWITDIAWEPLHRCGKVGRWCDRLVTGGKDGYGKVWDVRTGVCLAVLAGHLDSVECVRWGGEGLIYTASRDRTIKAWGAESLTGNIKEIGKLVSTLKGHSHRINTLALSTDYVMRTGPFDHTCTKHTTIESAYQSSLERYEAATAGGTKPETMVSGSDDFTLFLWTPRKSKHPIKRMTGHQQAVNHLAFSPDGRYFASASFDKKVKVWSGTSGDFITTLTGHVGAVYRVAWSSDSRFLVTASKDSTAKLWEMPAGRRARETLPGHADEVYALDWNPNGSSVVTGSKDRTIKVWKH